MVKEFMSEEEVREVLDTISINKRERIGCDKCKSDVPTEKFIGYCKNVLWLCGMCWKEIIRD